MVVILATGLAAAACRTGSTPPPEAAATATDGGRATSGTTAVTADDGPTAPAPTSTAVPFAMPEPAATDPAGWSQILGRPEATTVTLSVLASRAERVEVLVEALPAGARRRTPTVELQAGRPAAIDLDGLAPATAYRYLVLHDGQPGAEHRFRTAVPPGTDFTFTIDADPHNRDPRFNGALYRRTLTNAVADRPDLHIDLGDTFMTEKGRPASSEAAEASFVEMRPYLGVIGADAPLFLVNGNHEAELGWLLGGAAPGASLPGWATALRQRYYPTPIPSATGAYRGAVAADATLGRPRDAYYSWTWGDARFIVLDPFWYTVDKPQSGSTEGNWNWTLGRAQYDWLHDTLAANRSPFVFVFTHHLVGGTAEARGGVEVAGLFEWGGHNVDGSDGFAAMRPGWGEAIHPMLVRYGVTAVFHGHDHVYVHQTLDGIAYQEVPQPSNAEYDNTRIAAEYGYLQGTVLGSSGHLRVRVSTAGATVEYVRAYLPEHERADRRNATVADRYVLTPRR